MIFFPCVCVGAIALTNTQFAEGINRVSITSQNCVGTEDSLASCSDLGGASGSCGRFEDAGIVCQGMYACKYQLFL